MDRTKISTAVSASGTNDTPINLALTGVFARIEAARSASKLAAPQVTLLAVSKQQPPETIRAALAAGQRHFAENRVQEALDKWPSLKAEFPDISLHLIGPLQTNKVKEAVALFEMIETLDRPKLAASLASEMKKQSRIVPCLIQINTGDEPQKAGISPREADDFIRACKEEWKLPVVGLMCIPPANDDPALHFTLLREIARRHGLETLSMGMSGDFELAVRMGATQVRVGSAIFGERISP